MDFEVTILGSSSATPIYQRHPTAQIIRIHERFFLVDCAEGTLLQFIKYSIRFHRIDHVFISHLHGDHYLGIMGVLSTLHLQGRKRPLHLYGTSDLKKIVDIQLELSDCELRYPLVFHVIDPSVSAIIHQDDVVKVTTLPMNHRIPCCGFLFEEKQRPRNLVKSALATYRLKSHHYDRLKAGEDVVLTEGSIVKSKDVTRPPSPYRRYAYCSDTLYSPDLASSVKDVDLLYHEATFLHELLHRAEETFHSTALQAATVAKDAKVKKLLIGHFSARYKHLDSLLQEAREVFDNTFLAQEGDTFSIPYIT
ncbi:MAG: ribonuclease Z, partial [Bacteroidota bacterium]